MCHNNAVRWTDYKIFRLDPLEMLKITSDCSHNTSTAILAETRSYKLQNIDRIPAEQPLVISEELVCKVLLGFVAVLPLEIQRDKFMFL